MHLSLALEVEDMQAATIAHDRLESTAPTCRAISLTLICGSGAQRLCFGRVADTSEAATEAAATRFGMSS